MTSESATMDKRSDWLVTHAAAFLTQFAQECEKSDEWLRTRLESMEASVQQSGTYEHSSEELEYGCRVAWRNSTKCIGRRYYPALRVRDCRDLTSTDEIADDLMLHLCEAQNNGALRSMISVYRPRSPEFDGFRIWNQQLIRFAGFRRERFGNQVVGEPEWQTSREIIGDPVSVELTEIALGLGWKPEQIHGFEPLPLIVQSPRACPEWYPIPKQNILTVKLSHPDYEWFESLDLEWYALPMVSNMLLEIGGVEYPAAPFSGWYMSTEIALRNLTDRERYDLLSVVADHLGLDTKSGRTLWKDKASVVIHEAVLTSFEAAGVKIVDHHTASRDFMKFAEQEQRANRDVFANWRWIVPPTSGSLTDVFHTKWRDEIVSPNFFYQSDPWKHSVEEPRAPRQDCPEASSSKTLNPVRKCPFH